jgi:tRNA pseudouridine55 synthase
VTTVSGLIIVDKPSEWTSHDVVARIRRLAGTRRVGHAGTLDPMATGVLVVGVEKATRLLGHLALTEKEYLATIRLGQATDTGDAQGTVIWGAVASGLTLAQVSAAAVRFTGQIQQVPPATSAIKVGGQRAYKLARRGETPVLAARTVTVPEFTISDPRPDGETLDVAAAIRCSSGTYVRALARDLGEALGVGGHLTMLRRTRVGPYRLSAALTLDELAAGMRVIPLAEAAAAAFPVRVLTAEQARVLGHGARLPPSGPAPGPAGGQDRAGPAGGEDRVGPVAAIGPDGTLVALVEDRDGAAVPVAVFVP